MRLIGRFTAGIALAITVCWVFALALSGSTDTLLFLAPALLIVAPLIAGRYLGEELIARLIAKGSRPPRRSAAPPASAPRPPLAWSPRGARLLAFSRAERPPPPGLLLQT
jgi:hypothetical protein